MAAARIKDVDYLGVSARVRAMENDLVTRERMEQLLEARTNEDAAKLLQEWGYPELDASHPEQMDAALAAAREATLSDLATSVPDPRYLDIFRIKYDYHNVKAVLKAQAMDTDPTSMLMDGGRVPKEELMAAVKEGNMDFLPSCLADGAAAAKEVLDTTRDPQLCDIILDRWCYHDMNLVAQETESAFLLGYVKAQIDGANLRSLVRALRMGKNADFLETILFEGGDVDEASILKVAAAGGAGLADLYSPTLLVDAAEIGGTALQGGPLTDFERACDDALTEYLSGAQLKPFGEEPVLGFLAAKEMEYTNLRILLLGRGADLQADVIRARLRASYG